MSVQLLTLSLYWINLLAEIFHLVVSGVQSALVAVSLSVQMGVYCFMHREVPAVRALLQSTPGFMDSIKDWPTPFFCSIEAHVSPCATSYVMTHNVRGPVASTKLVRVENNTRTQARLGVEKNNIVRRECCQLRSTTTLYTHSNT